MFTGIGTGLHPVMVVREILAAVEGCRVYAETHLATGQWLAKLFDAASTDMKFRLCDLRTLLVPASKAVRLHSEDIRQAQEEARARFGPSSRPAQDAAHQMAFARRVRELHFGRLAGAAAAGIAGGGTGTGNSDAAG